MRRFRAGSLACIVASACAADPPTLPGDGEGSSGTTSAEPSTTSGSTPATTSAMDSSGGATTSPGTDTGTGATPQLELMPPKIDFGDVDVSASDTQNVFVLNAGDGPATGVALLAEGPGFAIDPATAGCPPVLDPGDSCTATILFAPTIFGPLTGSLTASADAGPDALADLTGAGVGISDNLIVNGDAEAGGAPPVGWTEEDGAWEATADFAHDGTLSLSPVDGSPPLPHLIQIVDLSPFEEGIDAGILTASFEGWQRANAAGNNPGRIELLYRDASGQTLDMVSSVLQGPASWIPLTDVRPVPPGTTDVLVRLECMLTGGANCDAYFDSLSLVLSYP